MSKLRSGLIFSTLGVYSNFLLQLVVSMVLSHLLTPKQYGVVAIMQVFIIFFAMLIEAGMGPAIIQDRTLSKEENRILFNYSALFAAVLAVAFGFFGLVLALVYGNPIYRILTWIQAISILFNGLNIVPTALLNKKKQFKAVNFSLVSANLLAGIFGVILAFWGFGVYALIVSAIVSSVINLVWNSFFVNIKFSKSWDTAPLKRIWHFSKNQFSSNFITYFSRNTDNILIGKFIGASSLAEYNKAYQLLLMPNTLLLGIVTPVLQPVLSEFQDDVVYIRNFAYKIMHLLGLLGIPLSVFLSFTSKPIIFFFFGNQWGNAVFPFLILSTTIWTQICLASFGGIVQARNKVKLLAQTSLINGIIEVGMIAIGILLGSINTVAICLTIGFYIAYIYSSSRFVRKVLDDSYFNYIKIFIRPMILGILLGVIFYFITFLRIQNIYFLLFLNSFIFAMTCALFIGHTEEKKYLNLLFGREK